MGSELLTDALSDLAESFGIKLTDKRLEIYCQKLQSIPRAALNLALERSLVEYKFFPSIAELLDLCGCKPLSLDERAEKEFHAIPRQSSGFSGGMIQDTGAFVAHRQLGGIKGFGVWDVSREPFKLKEFIAAYREYHSLSQAQKESYRRHHEKLKQRVDEPPKQLPPTKAEAQVTLDHLHKRMVDFDSRVDGYQIFKKFREDFDERREARKKRGPQPSYFERIGRHPMRKSVRLNLEKQQAQANMVS